MKLKDIAKTYPLALGSAAGIIVLAGLLFWRSSEFDDTKETLANRERESERLTSNVRNSAKLTNQLDELAAMTETIAGRLTKPTDLAGNQQYFYKLEADNKVKLSDLRQVSQARSSKKKASTLYSTVGYSLKVQGDYAHVLQFIRSIESGERLAVIEGAEFDLGGDLKKGEEVTGSSPLTVTLNLQFLGTL